MTNPTGLRPVVLGLLAVLLLGACGSSAGPTPSSTPGGGEPSAGTPSAGTPSGGPGDVGGGSTGEPGATDPDSSVGGPVDPAPVDPAQGQPKIVTARPGQLNPRPVGASRLTAFVDGHRVLVQVTWWSGVEPCNVLDSVNVEKSGKEITIQLVEGSADANAICIEIAQEKATIVDLGDLDPGIYTISALGGGDAHPIKIGID